MSVESNQKNNINPNNSNNPENLEELRNQILTEIEEMSDDTGVRNRAEILKKKHSFTGEDLNRKIYMSKPQQQQEES